MIGSLLLYRCLACLSLAPASSAKMASSREKKDGLVLFLNLGSFFVLLVDCCEHIYIYIHPCWNATRLERASSQRPVYSS